MITVALAVLTSGGGWCQPSAMSTAPTVETRTIPGRDLKQVRARAIVDAPPYVVRAVIADVERYPAFMPYVKESRLLSRGESGEILNYQRLSFGLPLVHDRHYVIRIDERQYLDANHRRAWTLVWRLQDGLPPDASSDAIRVTVNSGYWDLRSARASAAATEVRYCVFSDPAGTLPKWLVGRASSEGIPRLFAAVAAAAKTPRYAALAPPAQEGPIAAGTSPGDCADTAPTR